MHSLKATCLGRTFAQAKPNEYGGKKSRVRIPKQERKAMVESFIKKHQKLNNGNFPSLSLTHKEVGGSFYTVREIVREIIQENRVLGPAESIFVEKDNDQELKQTQSGSILIDPVVAPFSLSLNGSHVAPDQKQYSMQDSVLVPSNFSSGAGEDKILESGENINESEAGLKENEYNMSVCWELEASQSFRENTGMLAQNSSGSIIEVPTSPSCLTSNENHVLEHDVGMQEKVEKLHDSFSAKLEDQKLESGKPIDGTPLDADEKDGEIEEVVFRELSAPKPVYLEEISSATSAIPDKRIAEGILGQLENKISDSLEKEVGENFVNPASINAGCIDTKDSKVLDARACSASEIKESNNEILTAQTIQGNQQVSSNEPENAEKDITNIDNMTSVVGDQATANREATTLKEAKASAMDSSSSISHVGTNVSLNRIKLESWKGVPNNREEKNPLLEALKSFLNAFIKFWTE